MRFSVVHGPDRVLLREDDAGQLVSADGIPFHGIAPRALIPWLEDRGDGRAVWERNGHLLDDTGEPGAAELSALRTEARRSGVLSLTQSCRAVRRYVHDRLGEALPGDAHAEVWNTKEGHTSSVWVVTVESRGEPERRFVVNVARDPVAGAELRDASERLIELAARHPQLPLARVHEVTEVEVGGDYGDGTVVVTRNDLVDGALEIHPLPPDNGGTRGYALVERFLTSDESPAAIRAVRGRVVTADEADLIERCVERVRAAGSPDLPIELNVHEGDVVWNGREAVVVALS
jgi:hypothetical protein